MSEIKGLSRAQRAYDAMEPPDGCPECQRREYAREVAARAEALGLDYDQFWDDAMAEWDDWSGTYCWEHKGRKEDYD